MSQGNTQGHQKQVGSKKFVPISKRVGSAGHIHIVCSVWTWFCVNNGCLARALPLSKLAELMDANFHFDGAAASFIWKMTGAMLATK